MGAKNGKKKRKQIKIKKKSTQIKEMIERQSTEFYDKIEQHRQTKNRRIDRFLDLYKKSVNSKDNYN